MIGAVLVVVIGAAMNAFLIWWLADNPHTADDPRSLAWCFIGANSAALMLWVARGAIAGIILEGTVLTMWVAFLIRLQWRQHQADAWMRKHRTETRGPEC